MREAKKKPEEAEAQMQHGYTLKITKVSSSSIKDNYWDANTKFELRRNVNVLPTTLLHLSLHTCFASHTFDLLGQTICYIDGKSKFYEL